MRYRGLLITLGRLARAGKGMTWQDAGRAGRGNSAAGGLLAGLRRGVD